MFLGSNFVRKRKRRNTNRKPRTRPLAAATERLEPRHLLAAVTGDGVADVVEVGEGEAGANAAHVQSLHYKQFKTLTADEIVLLTPTQVRSIPNAGWLRTVTARAALTADQVTHLRVNKTGIKDLTAAQRDALTTEQIQSLSYRQFRYLSADQVPLLTGAQIQSIPSAGWLRTIAARGSFTADQIVNLNVKKTGIKDLTESQRAALTVEQIESLSYRQFRYVSKAQVPSLTADQIGSIPSAGWLRTISARAALTGEQVQSLQVNKTGLKDLTEAQRAAVIQEQVEQLSYRNLRYLNSEQIPWVKPEQVATIPSAGWLRTIGARAAFAGEQVQALNVAKTGVKELTEPQRGELSWDQVRALTYKNFRYLPAKLLPGLTPAQVATIPNAGWLKTIAARAAFGPEQVQALNVAKTGIRDLTEVQREALLSEQVESLSFKNFRYLNDAQVPWLTAEQVGSVPNAGWLRTIAARDALTAEQVQALRVGKTGIRDLNEKQRAALLADQIAVLTYRDFGFLKPTQIPHLTLEQVASVPNSGWMKRIPLESRAAFSEPQTQSVNTAKVSISLLTPRQRLQIAKDQIQSLNYRDFRFLRAEQAQQLTNDQMGTIPNAGHFRRIPDAARAALSRDQLFAVDGEIFTSLMRLPASFAVAEPAAAAASQGGGHDSAPHPDDPERRHEHLAAFALVPHDQAEFISVQSGDWSDPETWKNKDVPPTPDSHVLISEGHTVTFDTVIVPDDAVKTVRVDGELEFEEDEDTQLAVDTLVIDVHGLLTIGTDDEPIDGDVAARVVFADNGVIDTTWDPNQLSRGLISHGAVQIHGEDVTPFVSLAVDPRKGDTELVLDTVPTNWEVGDRLVLTGTNPNYKKNQDEELEIVAINGTSVSIDADSDTAGDQGLAFHHVTPDGDGDRSPNRLGTESDIFKVYVANMNRNVVFASANPDLNGGRGHVMFMHNQRVDVQNAGFYGLGRTDKRNPANDPVFDDDGKLIEKTGLNPRGRYAVHFHRAGTNYEDHPGWVSGSVVVDSPGWGFVNHESYVNMHDNVAFHVVGSGFTGEVGTEIGSFVGNLSINNSGSGDGLEAREDIFDFAHGGHGFWLQGPLIEVRDNIAAGSAQGAFVFFTQSSEGRIDAELLDDKAMAAGRATVPVGTVPLKRVEGNVAFAALHGLETWFHLTHMNDGQSYIRDFQSWNTRSSAVHTPYTGRTTISNATVIGNVDRPRGTAFSRNNVTNQMTYDNVTALGYNVGISVPVNRTTVIRDGHFAAVQAIRIDRAHDRLREVDIVGDPQFDTLSEKQLRGRTQYDIYMNGRFQMDNFDLETLFTPDIVRLGTIRFNDHQVYYLEQAHDFVPFKEGMVPEFVPEELIGKTNQELFDEFGITFAGAIAPADAVEVDRVNGLVGSRSEYQKRLALKSRKYTNQLEDYRLVYIDQLGNRVVEDPVDLREGWNLLTHIVNGEKRTFFVFGDTIAPEFRLSSKTELVVHPDGLKFGITIRGTILDNSFGRKSFKKKFNDLESRPILEREDGTKYLVLEFTIKDLAGNTTKVRLEVTLDPNAPLVPGTGQRDLPPRELPTTLYELLRFYIIT